MNQTKAVEILLIEDNDEDANLAIRSLKKQKIANSIFRVCDGVEALDYIFAKNEYKNRNVEDIPKLILLDLKMPKVNGMEVLKEIRENEVTKHIPVVVMTSSREERDITESYQLGVNSYIVKPVDFTKFAEAIHEIGFYWLVLNEPPI